MMTVNRLIAFTLLLFGGSFITLAQQEGTKPLSGNSILQNHKQNNIHNSQKTTSASVILPFFDDFSYLGPYPDPTKWQTSQSVFINRGYPIAPPTIGVATFDGLSRFGYPYNISAAGGSFPSDTLMSVPIRLDSTLSSPPNPIGDSVYLSFYYQAAGRGDLPEQNDVLSLFFIAPDDTSSNFLTGTPVWTKSGYSIGLPTHDTGFHRVMIPIYRTLDDTVFFQDSALKTGFRFVFVNWGTQCGAIDHWHIDQVYLQKNRSMNDTVYPDISFVYDEQSLLKNYMQMPYNQFAGASDMDTAVKAVLRNNNNVKTGSIWSGATALSTEYQILDNANVQVALTTAGTNNVFNYDSIGYCKDPALIRPSLGGFTYNSGPFLNPTSFLFKFYVKNCLTFNPVKENDTAYFRQDFQNYFSYDDGTAEAAYYAPFYNGEIAVKYKVNVADTLRAIDIFFDPVAGVNILQYTKIGLMVRADNGGHPGAILLADTNTTNTVFFPFFPYPTYGKIGYDVFARYQLSKAVPIDSGQTFYVGTYQQIAVQLGVGLDMNHDTHKNNFYYDGTNWNTSNCQSCGGSLMIHPVFGDSLSTVGIKSYKDEKENVKIYPNPATDEIFISCSEKITKVLITDLLGNTLMEERNNTEKITVSALPNGLYMLRTFNAKGSGSTQKLIISR